MIQWVTKTTPMEQQLKALEACNLRTFYAYFMDPGLGKTKVVIDEAQTMATQGLLNVVVVVCPKSIMSVWWEEIETHGAIPANTIMWDGDGLAEVGYINTKAILTYYIINIDAINPVAVKVKGPDGAPVIKEIVRGRPVYEMKVYDKGFTAIEQVLLTCGKSMVVIDESTIIKNPDAKRTKAMWNIGAMATYRRILTGTPLAGGPLDAYAQMRFLHPTAIFKYNYFAFRGRYAQMGGFQSRQVVGYKNLDHLSKVLAEHSFMATKDEYLDLPPRTTQIRNVDMSATSWKIYRTLVDELVVEFAGGEMHIDMAMKKITKLRQLTGGWIKDDEGVAHPVGMEKLSELKHLLDECQGQKVIIWCEFVHEILALQQIHPMAKVFHGGMNPTARDEARHAFEHGNAPIIIIQNATGSMGLTLNAASVSIFYSNSNYPLHKQQSRDRNYRKGQDKPVTEYELIVRGSIDETNYNNIVNGIDLASAVVRARGNADALREALIPKLKKVDWRAPKKGKEG